MARQATIIDSVIDHWGDQWDVRERRPTKHGFDILLGWPATTARGRGGTGGPRVIVTSELAACIAANRDQPSQLHLSIGNSAIKRIRKLLGYNWHVDRASWWEDRADDLADLTLEHFSRKHRVSVAAAVNARHALFGPTLRPPGWWRTGDVVAILLSDQPRVDIADKLGISVGSVGRLRWQLKAGAFPTSAMVPDLASRKINKRLSARDLLAAADMLSSGLSINQTSAALGVSNTALRYRIKAGQLPNSAHTKREKNAGSTSLNKQEFVRMVSAGENLRKVSRKLGVSNTTIQRWKLELGIPLQKRGSNRKSKDQTDAPPS